MSRADQRHLPLLVVLVAVLVLLGAVLADGSATRAAPSAAAVAEGPMAEGSASPVDALAPDAGAVGRAGEQLMVVQATRDHLRPLVHTPVLLVLLAAGLAASAGARSFVVAAVTGGVRRSPSAHVRRRGPPAPAVV